MITKYTPSVKVTYEFNGTKKEIAFPYIDENVIKFKSVYQIKMELAAKQVKENADNLDF